MSSFCLFSLNNFSLTRPSHLSLSNKNQQEPLIDSIFFSSSHDARFFNSIKFVRYLLSNSAPHESWSPMFFGIGVPASAAESGKGVMPLAWSGARTVPGEQRRCHCFDARFLGPGPSRIALVFHNRCQDVPSRPPITIMTAMCLAIGRVVYRSTCRLRTQSMNFHRNNYDSQPVRKVIIIIIESWSKYLKYYCRCVPPPYPIDRGSLKSLTWIKPLFLLKEMCPPRGLITWQSVSFL